MANLKSMNREQLNVEAARLGIADAEQLDKNADVIAAIEGSEAYQAEKAAEEDAARKAAEATTALKQDEQGITYIVNGVWVDPNGKPVKG